MGMTTPSAADVVPTRALHALLRVASAQGYDQQRVLSAAGIDFDPWSREAPATVPTLFYSRLYRHLMWLLQDEAFGLGYSHRQPPGSFRMMSLFVIHCSRLSEVLVRLAEFFDFCDSFHRQPTRRRQPYGRYGERVRITFYRPASRPSEEVQAQASALFMMGRFLGWLTGQELPLLEVELAAPEPDDAERHRALFSCPVRFEGSAHALWVHADCLSWPVVQNEQSLRRFLRTAPYPLMTRRPRSDQTRLEDRVRALISQDLSRSLPGAREVAAALNMSTRTLHRHLRREGTSFQRIKDDCRLQAARAYLARPELTINAIAMLMGFQDASAFHRSFKKWTGCSPGEYRRRELLHNRPQQGRKTERHHD